MYNMGLPKDFDMDMGSMDMDGMALKSFHNKDTWEDYNMDIPR